MNGVPKDNRITISATFYLRGSGAVMAIHGRWCVQRLPRWRAHTGQLVERPGGFPDNAFPFAVTFEPEEPVFLIAVQAADGIVQTLLGIHVRMPWERIIDA